ncbi:unnamed protein product, partial [Medioppia subpectinata]
MQSSHADVYHAYQVIKAHGIPDENIIVMHYDDLANNERNPTPGVIVNRKGGPDVYKGVPKDYTGIEVTPQNFLAILRGDEELAKAGKKVVKSGPNDRIFVYLDDHGSEGYVVFPHGNLKAHDLTDTLVAMHKENKYKELVFYLAACYAGSMFDKILPNNINAYAMSATLPDELGWFSDCSVDEPVQFAVAWLNDSEHHDLTKESIKTQYDYIAHAFTDQHAQQYGDLSIAAEHLSNYMGEKQVPSVGQYSQPANSVPIPDAPIYLAQLLLRNRELMDKQIEEYVNTLPGIEANVVLNSKLQINNKECYHKLVDTFHDKCYNLGQNSYAIQKMKVLGNICHSSDADVNTFNQLLINYCNTIVKPNTNII